MNSIIVGIVELLFFIMLIALYIDAEVGYIMLYAIAAAMILSAITAVLSRRGFSVSCDDFAGTATVGGNVDIELKVRKTGFCILPFITVTGSFGDQNFVVRTSLVFSREQVVVMKFRPSECGLNTLVLGETKSSDFFGIIRSSYSFKGETGVAVLPRIVEYSGPEVLPRMLPSDNEIQEEGAVTLFGGMAGYEHRDYVNGDSPRKINYKLSAKRRRLMVRLDESNGMENTNIILSHDADGACAEQAYALAEKLVLQGFPVTVMCNGDRCCAVIPEMLLKLREWLAFRRLGNGTAVDELPTDSVNVVISPADILVIDQ